MLVSELFPPVVGGSAVLFANLYSRLVDLQVELVTDDVHVPEDLAARFDRIVSVPLKSRSWSLLDRASLSRYASLGRAIAGSASGRRVIAHCGRAIPEGFATVAAARLLRGPNYVCWTHGEELVTYSSSRELTLMRRLVHRHALAIIANSRSTARMLEAQGVPRSKIHVVYPGVDVESFGAGRRASVKHEMGWDDSLLLLTIGRLQRRKGHDLAIQAMARLRRTHRNARYLIVGKGQEEARLRQLIELHQLGDVVRIVGEVPQAELARYYASADIFLHPNRVDDDGDVEGFGIVFLEAAASGIPTIGGASGGVPEAVSDGQTGLLVGGRDVDELLKAIVTLADAPDLRRRMGEAGRERVAREFTWLHSSRVLRDLHVSLGASMPRACRGPHLNSCA